MKSHSGAKKRFRRTGSGKWTRRKAYKDHLLTKKSAKRKRRLGKTVVVDKSDAKRVSRMLPYG